MGERDILISVSGGGCATASSVERGVYDATAFGFWVAYTKKDVETYKRPFLHVRLKDYLHSC